MGIPARYNGHTFSYDYSAGNWSPQDRVGMTVHMRNADDTAFESDWWQADYLQDESRFLIVNKSRRVGWSFMTAMKGLLKALDPAVFGYTKQFISYNMSDATEKIAVAREHYYSLPKPYRYKRLVSDSKMQLEFEDVNGRSRSRLISWPSKAPRGKGGDISIDEYAYHAKDKEIYVGALPVISRGGNLEIGSTPCGNSGQFYELLTDRTTYPHFRRWHVPWYFAKALCSDSDAAMEAARGGESQGEIVKVYGTEILKELFRSMAPEDFEQEFACNFRDAMSSFITLEMIRANTPLGDDEVQQFTTLDDLVLGFDPKAHGDLYAGYDVGITNDASELIVLGHFPATGRFRQVANISLRKIDFDEQEAMLRRFLFELPVARLAIDSTGLGAHLAQNTRKASRTGNVEEVVFTPQTKAMMSEALWLGFNKRLFDLAADRELQQQVHSIKKTLSPGSRTPRFDAARNKKGHADKYWALALAYYAASHGYEKKSSLKDQWEARRKGRAPRSPADVLRKLAQVSR